jgi:hypothetical protein
MKRFDSFLYEKELALELHDHLNKKIWEEDDKGKLVLIPEVREKLLTIAEVWREFANVPEKAVKNILLTGGLANYNYTDYSDLDLHLLVDYDLITKSEDKEFLLDYYRDKKFIWALKHSDITIKGYPVELYAQPMTQVPREGQGIYSIKNNRWVQEPVHKNIDFTNDPYLKDKVAYYEKYINSIITSDKPNMDAIEKLKEKIKRMRNNAIAKGGEFSKDNLVFKALRNDGLLDKLGEYQTNLRAKELSLK